LALAALLALGGAALGQVVFTEQSVASGMPFQLDGASTHVNVMAGGGAVGDFNRDGWPDLFVLGDGEVRDCLYINQADGSFKEEAANWGVARFHRGQGVTVGDFDRDGWLDVFITSGGDVSGPGRTGKHILYRNIEGRSFSNVAVAAGVNLTSITVPSGDGAAWGDIDNNGWLDLYVGMWQEGGDGNRLFYNRGDGGFDDITDSAGVRATEMRTFSPCFADMDGDGWVELLVAADFSSSHYFVNNGDLTFTDYTSESDTGHDTYGMGSYVADMDGDQMLDWYVTSIGQGIQPNSTGNFLYQNLGGHVFAPLNRETGVPYCGWAWGTVAIDADQDGRQDLAVTNGWHEYVWHNDEPSRFLYNKGDMKFANVAADVGIDHRGLGRGMVHFDYDHDGDMDLAIFSRREPLALYRNDTENNHRWLIVRVETLHHPGLAPDGVGALLYLDNPALTKVLQISANSNYLGNSQKIAHFGMGSEATANLRIRFPGNGERAYQLETDKAWRVWAPHPNLIRRLCAVWRQETLPCGAFAHNDVRGMVSFVNQGSDCPPEIWYE
jgi:hypothetical protein